MQSRAVPFRPKLEGMFRNRFYEKAALLTQGLPTEHTEKVIEEEIDWAENGIKTNIKQRKVYRAVWLFLRDLIHSNWNAEFNSGVLEMRLPSLNSKDLGDVNLQEKKEVLRSWMRDGRADRLSVHSEFIRKMEEGNSGIKSVLELVGDGKEISKNLKRFQKGQIEISEAVDPELVLVEESAIDQFTNLKISDIWRYFRYTWSNPSESTPGRSMYYLIRDKAYPNKPIIGIASLENSAVQITDRDNYIGWTPSAFQKRIKGASKELARIAYQELIGYLDNGIKEISLDDFELTEDDILRPTEKIIQYLKNTGQQAARDREDRLQDKVDQDNKSELGGITKDAVEALYVKKRSEKLARLLSAKKQINELLESLDFEERFYSFSETDTGRAAIRNALVAQKEIHVGSSIMELNVCGAIPPYNEILGGKLVALLALSPKVISDYKNKYSNHKSEIASRMKNAPVYKPVDLAFIGTTSLYSVGSSQYNRLVIPKELFNSEFIVRWKQIGKTVGHGTMHISKATSFAFAEATSEDVGYNRINNVFGEGTSPKMRLLNMSVRELLEGNQADSNDFMKHAMSRIVYGSFLASNSSDYLLGRTSKLDYYFGDIDAQIGTQMIIDFWRERWVGSRLNYTPIFERLEKFNSSSIKVSQSLKDNHEKEIKSLEEISMEESVGNDQLEFAMNLYRGKSAFADEFSELELSKLHVTTNLDKAIIANVAAGNDVVLTGNPGDGKTHMIKMLGRAFEELGRPPIVELDASTKTSKEIYEEWKSARELKLPFVIAINAAVLYELSISYPDFPPINSAGYQLINTISFDGEGNKNDIDSQVVVYDLSRRNNLDEIIVKKVISNFVELVDLEYCKNVGLEDVVENVALIQNELFIKRLMFIFNRISYSGYHATLRELQSFFSYVVFGNRKVIEIVKTSGSNRYKLTTLIYEGGEGDFFNAIRDAFDPANITHPIIDEMIVNGGVSPSSWMEGFNSAVENVDPNNVGLYKMKKRDFYFFNKEGIRISEIANDTVGQFISFLGKTPRKQIKELIQKINLFFAQPKTGELLKVWSSHRFGNRERTVLFSQTSKKFQQFSIKIPQLIEVMSDGVEFIQNYLKLEVKGEKNKSLVVDFEMYKLLVEAEKGVPVMYLDTNVVRRVWRFMDLMQVQQIGEGEEEVKVSIYDVHAKKEVEVTIDLEEDRFDEIIIIE